ncbi:type II secretion system protein GspN [uncultured Cloacibacillus sp.]|uniref:type II secretion system protein GspN n=1 Tax=uncultured Cloacibacillus sp. TaxID=889794 RepID=UPI0025DF0F83|nr:type II secretion system protein GspN [uncultured Cloacibacillus sp.]
MKKNLLRAAAALAGLIIGIAIFFPWDALGSSLFAFAAKEAASRGVYVTASSSEVSGLFKKNFSYKGVNADLPVARASLREVSVEPDILSSLLSGEKSARLTFGRGSLVPVTRQPVEWNSGSASVRVTENTIIVEDISFTGPTSVSGSAEISPSAMRLVRARLLVKAPPELDRMFEMLRMTNMLPLKKVKEGEWRIER